MLGIDVFQQYNTITNWSQLKKDGVGAVWVKLTDGTTQASTHGDVYVSAAKSAGIAVGGYHFAESYASPEIQASTLANEVRRLGAVDIAPMLDLESNRIVDPENFRVRFWQHFNAVMPLGKYLTYASESWWTSGRLNDTLVAVPGEMVWSARWGTNDGTNQGEALPRWDVHQYTSHGVLAGAQGFLDLDDVRSNVFLSGSPLPTPPPSTDWVSTIMARLPVLQQGTKDAPSGIWFVHRLQGLLHAVGYAPAIDGDFGPITATTVREFQSAHGLTVDGIVGEHSWSVLVTGQAG